MGTAAAGREGWTRQPVGSAAADPPEPSRPALLSATLASLNVYNFRVYAAGQLMSVSGVWMQRVAQDWLVLTLTRSPAEVGVTTLLQFAPTVLIGPLGGLAADRYPIRRLLLCTNAGMALCSGLLAAITLAHRVQAWQVWIIAFALGTVGAVDMPARQSFVNDMVGTARLRNAISLNSAILQVGALIGPAISGLLISAVGAGYSFAINAVCYAGPIVALLRMRAGELNSRPARQALAEPVRAQLRQGLSYSARHPEILWPTVLVGAFGMLISSLPVTNAALARLVFHAGSTGYGVLSSCAAVGAVLGALRAASRQQVALRTIVTSAAVLSGLYVVASVAPGMIGYAIAVAAIGAGTTTVVTAANTAVQLAAPDEIRGRVMGLYLLVFLGSGALGGPFIGTVDQLFGARAGLLAGGLVTGAITAVVAAALARRARPRAATETGPRTCPANLRG
jgi:MFS family permease